MKPEFDISLSFALMLSIFAPGSFDSIRSHDDEKSNQVDT